MSIYKTLLIENQYLRDQIHKTRLEIQGIRDSLAKTPRWIYTEQLIYQLNQIPSKQPFKN